MMMELRKDVLHFSTSKICYKTGRKVTQFLGKRNSPLDYGHTRARRFLLATVQEETVTKV